MRNVQLPDTTPTIEGALAVIESESAVVFGRAERVAEACAVLRSHARLWLPPAPTAVVGRLARLLRARSGPLVQPVGELLLSLATEAGEPWDLLEVALAASDARVVSAALETLVAWVDRGSVDIDLAKAERFAAIVQSAEGPLARDETLEQIERVLRQVRWPAAPGDDPVLALYKRVGHEPLRRLAARVLDLSGTPPSERLAAEVLGEASARALGAYLVYTRARHVDLLDLARPDGSPGPLVESLRVAEQRTDPGLLRDVIAELGWRRVNLGLDVHPVVGVAVDGSLPFLLTPAEAVIFEGCRGARRVFEHLLIVAHGGTIADGDGRPGGSGPIDRFRTYNLAHAEVLADMLDAGPLTTERVHTILRRMDRIVADFVALFRDRTDEASVAERVYTDLKARVSSELEAAASGASLSPTLTRLVLMFEDPKSAGEVRTLHGLKRYLHQRGLNLGFGLLEAGRGTNRSVDVVIAGARRIVHVAKRIDYVDFEPAPDAGPSRERVPYPVSIVAQAFAQQLLNGETSLPSVKVFCYGNEVHYFVAFRNHPVFIRMDFSPPLGGGMIDLQYYGVSKYDLDSHPRVSLEGIRSMFERLDFEIHVENTRIHARYDKERALTLADLCDHAEMLFRLCPYLMDVDWIIGQLTLDEEARLRVGKGWAELFARWGVLPLGQLLTSDRLGIVVGQEPLAEGTAERRWSGDGPYVDRFTGRPSRQFIADLRAQLSRYNLAELVLIEREHEAGQIPLLQRVLQPLRRAVARGALVESETGLRPAPADCFERLHEAEVLARVLGADDERVGRAARLAHLAAALERTVNFETTGSLNGYDVQRAWLELRDETLALYVLRDHTDMIRLAVYGPEGTLSRRRARIDAPWRDTVSDDIGWLASHLRRSNFLPSWIDSPDQHDVDVADIRSAFAVPNPTAGRRPLPGEHALEGLRASPGRAVGPARLGLEGRQADHLDGGILVVPSLRPEDCRFLFNVSGVLCTGGSILSHAGLLAVEFGRPALIVRGRWERPGDGRTRFVYGRAEYEELERRVGEFVIVERRHVREHDAVLAEGDLLALDADEGTVRILGQDPTAIALHDGLYHLAQSNLRLSRATTDTEALFERGRRLRALHQLERLFVRLADPVLVHHAVRELLLGAGAAEVRSGGRDKARLIELLISSPTCAETAREAVARVGRGLAERFEAAVGDARRRIPVSDDPGEILGLRLSVVRFYGTLEAVLGLVQAAPADMLESAARAVGDIERATIGRLSAQRGALRDRVRRSVEQRAPMGDMRHVLAQLERLDDVLGVTGEDQAWRESAARQLATDDRRAMDEVSRRWILDPRDGGVELEPLVGWKTAFLAEIGRHGFGAHVPSWFVVTDRAFRAMLEAQAPAVEGRGLERNGTLREAILGVLRSADATLAQKAERIQRLWLAADLPADVAAAVSSAYRGLASEGAGSADLVPAGVTDEPGQPFVAVRSSAHQEDTDAAAHAGEFDTYLFVRGERSLVEHLKRAWSGLWTERAIHNRSALGLGDGMEGGGVLVQRMVWSRAAGVLQTTNVAEGLPHELVINVGLGLGEGVVSGLVAADHVVVSKEQPPASGNLRFRYITAEKRERMVFDTRAGHGTLRVPTLSHQRLRPVLEYVELVELVQVALNLEKALGQALDIEFAYEGPSLRILQVRRIPAWRAVWWESALRFPLESAVTARGRGAVPHASRAVPASDATLSRGDHR